MKRDSPSDNIWTLSTLEHIRRWPTLYFDKCFKQGSLDPLPFGVLCHAIDEYFDGNCSEVELTIWKDAFSVRYDVGMPLSIRFDLSTAEIIMTDVGAFPNIKKHNEAGQEFCDPGMATVNFASQICRLTTAWAGKKANYTFINGKTDNRDIVPFKKDDSWTEIYFKPKMNLFEGLELSFKGVRRLVKDINKQLPDLRMTVKKGSKRKPTRNLL